MQHNSKLIPLLGRLVAVVSLLISGAAHGQTLWPGDVNNNGRVSSVDFLYWGLAYNATGPARPGASAAFTPQALGTPWVQSFPGGLNFAYADCDGDGEVDNDDSEEAIEVHFGLTHGVPAADGFVNGTPGASPGVKLVPSAISVLPGAVVTFDVVLGESALPVANFYGVAMKLRYSAGLVEPAPGLVFDEEDNGWIDPDGQNSKYLFVNNGAQGQAEIALTRTNQQTVASGFGKIASLTIVIEDIIVGKSVDTFRISIDSILLIDNQLNRVRTATDAVEVIVKVPNAVDDKPSNAPAIRITPNPARDVFTVESTEPLQSLRLFDALGRVVPIDLETLDRTRFRISAIKGPPGLYQLVGAGPAGVFTRSLILSP